MTEDTDKGRLSDPLSLNLYTYCHNEPIMYTDPSGHNRETIGITKDDKEKNTRTSSKSTSSKSSTSQSSKTSTSTKPTTTTTKPTTTSKPNVDSTIADIQREKLESRQQSTPTSPQTPKDITNDKGTGMLTTPLIYYTIYQRWILCQECQEIGARVEYTI